MSRSSRTASRPRSTTVSGHGSLLAIEDRAHARRDLRTVSHRALNRQVRRAPMPGTCAHPSSQRVPRRCRFGQLRLAGAVDRDHPDSDQRKPRLHGGAVPARLPDPGDVERRAPARPARSGAVGTVPADRAVVSRAAGRATGVVDAAHAVTPSGRLARLLQLGNPAAAGPRHPLRSRWRTAFGQRNRAGHYEWPARSG
jgi:hypothetical protein